MTDVHVTPAAAMDLPAVRALLTRCGLPLDGIEAHVPTMLVARRAGEIVGTAALEMYERGALLRSVAVHPDRHGTGLGSRLTKGALDLARAAGVPAVYLLTTTAEGFFPRFDFHRIARKDVPDDVRQSVEFRSACPASAVVMRCSMERRSAATPAGT